MRQEDTALGAGRSARTACYALPDNELAVGSTLGSPTLSMVIKGTGAIERIHGVTVGEDVFGSLVLHHWDEQTGMHLEAAGGKALVLPADVADAAEVEAAATKMEEAFGAIDIWVNVAMVSVFSPFKETQRGHGGERGHGSSIGGDGNDRRREGPR